MRRDDQAGQQKSGPSEEPAAMPFEGVPGEDRDSGRTHADVGAVEEQANHEKHSHASGGGD